MGTACYVKRAAEIIASLQAEYGIGPGETPPDGKFSVAAARCLGSCGLAPLVMLDGEVLGRLSPDQVLERVKDVIATKKPQAVPA